MPLMQAVWPGPTPQQYEPSFTHAVRAPEADHPFSMPINPWNPYLRTNGRFYNHSALTAPYGVSQLDPLNPLNPIRTNPLCNRYTLLPYQRNAGPTIPFQTYRSNMYPLSRESPHRSLHRRSHSPLQRHVHRPFQTPNADHIDDLSPISLSSDESNDGRDNSTSDAAQLMNMYERDYLPESNYRWVEVNSMAMPNDSARASSRSKRQQQFNHKQRKCQRFNEPTTTTTNETNGYLSTDRGNAVNNGDDNGSEQIDIKPHIKVELKKVEMVVSDNSSGVTIKMEPEVKIEPSSSAEEGDSANECKDTKEHLQPLIAVIKQEYVSKHFYGIKSGISLNNLFHFLQGQPNR